MSEKYIFTLLGGDRRQAIIAKKLLSLGHTVRIFGLDSPSSDISGSEMYLSVQKALIGCDHVILPLPVSRDNIFLNLPFSDKNKLLLCDIVKAVSKNKGTLILGGMIPQSMSDAAEKLGVNVVDYYKEGDLQMKNALPSAEGAIMVAMENTDKTIKGMNVLVTGYGRIGKLTAEKMKALGAEVFVGARRDESLCEISMCGYVPVRITDQDDFAGAIDGCDVIINTVPSGIITKKVIDGTNGKPLYIEVASSPGGIDTFYAQNKGWKVVFAPSLPGRYAPVSAGEYIFETISSILTKRGIDI